MCEPANNVEGQVLTLEVQNHAHVVVLRCSGRIVHGDGADDLLRAAMSQDKRHLLIDLSGVDTIDAGGLGVLATLEKWAMDGNRTIQLTNPSKRVREVLEATKLISLFQVFPAIQDCDDAA
jgi:anti-sigma B factor antagonist